MKKKLLPLFFSQSFRSIGISLVAFFSSVYIFKKTGDVLVVFAFYLVVYLAKMLAISLAENLALKIGLKKQVIFGHLLTIICLLAFAFSETNFFWIWPAAFFWGLAIGFFWFGRHGLVAKMSQKGSYGEAVGWASVLNTVLLLGVPFLGGLLISRFGYLVLFISAGLFVLLALLSAIPLVEKKTHQDTTFQEVFKLFKEHPRMVLAYFALGAIGAFYITALILHIFLFLGKEMALGGFFSLSMLLVALAHFLTGKWVDKRGKKALIASGAIMTSLVWLGRFLAIEVGVLFVLDVIDRIAGGMRGIPLEVLSFEKAIDGHSTGRALLFRETAITLGEVSGILVLVILTLLNLPLKIAFIAATLVCLLPLLILKNGELE